MAYGSWRTPSVSEVSCWAAFRTWDTATPQFQVTIFWDYAIDEANRKYKVRITKMRFIEGRQLTLGGQSVTLKVGFSTSDFTSQTISLAQNFGPPYYVDMTSNKTAEFTYKDDGSPNPITLYWSANVTGTDGNRPQMTSMRAFGNGTSQTADSTATNSNGKAYFYNADMASVVNRITSLTELGYNLRFNDNGTWRKAKKVWFNDNGTWRQAKQIWYNDNGTWRKCSRG